MNTRRTNIEIEADRIDRELHAIEGRVTRISGVSPVIYHQMSPLYMALQSARGAARRLMHPNDRRASE